MARADFAKERNFSVFLPESFVLVYITARRPSRFVSLMLSIMKCHDDEALPGVYMISAS